MRADRLLSMLMLLQIHGKMPASQLAKALEVCERTVYRDMVSLSTAGIPVYAEKGVNGGYALVEGYRTSLTGLTDEEVQALSLLEVPESLVRLGVSAALKSALLKLSAALPGMLSQDQLRMRRRIYLDPSGWEQPGESESLLNVLYRAVMGDRLVLLTYRLSSGVELEQVVAPYALAAKAGVWHLVFCRQGALEVERVADLLGARVQGGNFTRPQDFDLEAFWQDWVSRRAEERVQFSVRLRITGKFIPYLHWYLGERVHDRLTQAGPADEQGRVEIDLEFPSFEAARERILSLGRGVEVLEPRALRRSVQDFAEQTLALYR
jgi:predicted DNA-binding transcriptional regulator YafY